MIKLLKQFIHSCKRSINYGKFNHLYYSSQIITSCAFPILKIRKKIWVLEFFDETENDFEYHWFENREELDDIVKVLKNFNYYFFVKEYEIEI